jgi:hypothetical protein
MLYRTHRTIYATFFASFSHFLSWGKISFIVGSKMAFFSVAHCFSPLVGKYGGAQTSLAYFMIRTVLKIIMTHSLSFLILAYHIPSFFQSLYFALIAPQAGNPVRLRSKVALSALCLVSIGLFVIHPVGQKAYLYSLPWLFPAITAFIQTRNLFVHALASTFVAHAIGSVLWIYTNPMTPEVWIGLIPVVCVERLLFAVGIVILSKIYDSALSWLPTVSQNKPMQPVHSNT